MSLTKKVYLTISGYDIKLSDNLTFYQKDQLKLIFYINEYGIDYENNATTRALMPVNPLNAILFIENPDGVDSVSSAKIEDNAVTFYLDSTHTQYVGVSRMQLRLFDQDGCAITLPHFTFEIRENIYGSGDVRFQNVVMVDQTGTVILTEDNDLLDVGDILTMGTEVAYPQVTKTIKELPIKHGLDGTEKLIVEDNEATKQAPLGTIVDEIKQNSQEKIREIESDLAQTNAQLSDKADKWLVDGSINVPVYAEEYGITISQAVQQLKNEKLFFPNGEFEVDDLDGVRFLKGVSYRETIIKTNKDIITKGVTFWEDVKIDLGGNGIVKMGVNSAEASSPFELNRVFIYNAVSGIETELGIKITNCRIGKCLEYGIKNLGSDNIIENCVIYDTGKAGIKNLSKSLRMMGNKLYMTNRDDWSTGGCAFEDEGGTAYCVGNEIQQSYGGSLKFASYGTFWVGGTDGCGWSHSNKCTDTFVTGKRNKIINVAKTGSNYGGGVISEWKMGLAIEGEMNDVDFTIYCENPVDIKKTYSFNKDMIINNVVKINGVVITPSNFQNGSFPISNSTYGASGARLIPLEAGVDSGFVLSLDESIYGNLYYKFYYSSLTDITFKVVCYDGSTEYSKSYNIPSSYGKYSLFSVSEGKYVLLKGLQDAGGNRDLAKFKFVFRSATETTLTTILHDGNIFEIK